MSAEPEFVARFWGVRGSIACPGPDHLRYGGDTACVEIRCGGRRLILDGGTGLRLLGRHLAGEGALEADMLFTHAHLDHIGGLPFFAPAFRPDTRLRLWSARLPGGGLHDAICAMMSAPLFPVPIEIFRARMEFVTFDAGAAFRLGAGIAVRTALLNHPQGAAGYRIDFAGRSVCYVTDTEHAPGRPDRNILALIEGADLVIYDATYTDEEYPAHIGWGHSTWQEGARLCDAAGAGRLVLFHHDPGHDDDAMDRIGRAAMAARPGTLVARDGLEVRL